MQSNGLRSTNIIFYFSDFVLFLCLHGCMPSNRNAMGKRKSPTVTMISIKAEFAGNVTLLVRAYIKQVAKLLQYVYFQFLLSCFLAANKCSKSTREVCEKCELCLTSTQCLNTTCLTQKPSSFVCSCPTIETVGKQPSTYLKLT